MSRRFIDDNVEVLAFAPPTATDDTLYAGGHFFRNAVDGTRYTNEGDADAAIWGNWPANRYALSETFQRAPLLNASVGVAANLDFEILGTNAANTCSTFSTGGGLTLTTTTAANDQVIVLPHLDTKQTAWSGVDWATDDRVVFETTITTGASVTAAIVWAGLKLTNTSTVATDDNQVFVRYQDTVNTGKFQLVYSIAGTDTSLDTGVTVAVSTDYHIRLVIDVDRKATLYINGVEVATSAALTTAISLIPYIGVQTTAAAAKAITVRGLKLSKDLT